VKAWSSPVEISITGQSNICSKMVKADYSGAHVKVVNAKNKCLIGVHGLIVRETARAFTII